jgi:tetratricopeptide (TPR) repeat protein
MLACALGFSGRHHEARPLLEDAARFAGRLGQRAELASVQAILQWTEMNLGMYERARELQAAGTAFIEESGDRERMAYHHLSEAQFALLDARETGSQASYEAAYRFAQESMVAFRELEHLDEGLAWAELGYAAHCLGRHAEARRHLGQALRTARDAGALQTTMVALAHLAAVLADAEPERAVELYALATCHPYIGNSRLWQDLLEPRVTAAAARLPPDVVQAAQARGREGDWTAAVENWLRESASCT